MKGTKIIVIAVCLMLAAISMYAQEQKYELSEARVAPGFYLAPNGYEYQLPQYGLTISIPKQSYYKVPYLLKHNAYLITNDSIVSYCLYKYYLNDSYTDFALFGSYAGNMRYRVAEFKNNDEKDFLESIRKKKDYKSLRTLRTPFASFTHYSAFNEGLGQRVHGYYYLANNILIEFIVIPESDSELSKYDNIIKTLRKADLQKDLNDYLMMLSAIKSTVPGKEIELDLKKDEEEVEVLYAQELTTPTIAPQPSPFAEPAPKNNAANPEMAKNTSELANLLRASRGDVQAEEKNLEAVPVKITEPTELVVFKGGYIKPPVVEWNFDIQKQQLPVFSLATAQQKPIRSIEGNLLPIYPVVKRPDVALNVDVAKPTVTLASANLNTSTSTAEKTLISTITPVVKRPDVAFEIKDITQNSVMVASTKDITATTNAGNTLAITPVEKRPDVSVDVDVAKSEMKLADNTVSLNTSISTAEKTLISTITPVEKKPDVSLDVNVPETVLPIDNTSLNTNSSTVGTTLTSSIAPVIKQPEPTISTDDIKPLNMAVRASNLSVSGTGLNRLLAIKEVKKRPVSSEVKVAAATPATPTTTAINTISSNAEQKVAENIKVLESQPVNEATNTDPSVFVVTEEIAKDYWNRKQEATEVVSQPKFIDLTAPPVFEDRGRKRPQPTIVDKIDYENIKPIESKSDVMGLGVRSTNTTQNLEEAASMLNVNTATAGASEEQETANKRTRCSRFENVIIPVIEEQIIPYSQVQQKPTFNGGNYNKFALWIGDNMCYPEGLRQELNGYVTVEIVVASDGSIANVSIMSSPHKLLTTEVLYMLSTAPKWVPAMQDSKPVPVSVVIGVPVSAYL